MGLNPLVDKVRAAHPGAYDDLDDAQLTKSILAKHPEYEDLAAPPVNPFVPEMQTEGGGNTGPVAGKLTGLPGVNPHTPTNKEALGDIGLVAGGATAGVGSEVAPAMPAVVEALTKAAEAHPVVAKLLLKGLEVGGGSAATAGIYKLLKAFK